MRRDVGRTAQLQLQTLFSAGVTATLTDGQLLERFATAGGSAAETAFTTLVERHGLMVFRACCAILDDEHEAHDAFQATFLVLLRKGNTLWVRDSLGPWLHRVACRAAARTRVEASRRRFHEQRAVEQAQYRQGGTAPELAAVIHEEVDQLPDRYRMPIVLCELQGRSYAEAAQFLRCPIGTVRSRLARGRERLRERLVRRGLGPSAATLSAALAPEPTLAGLPATWTQSLIHNARCILAADALTLADVPASVLGIAEGVLGMISLARRTLIAATVLTAFGLALGAGVLAQPAADPPPVAPAQPRAADVDDRWVARLPGGGSLEILGVSTYPAGPKTWWRPDGLPLADPPCDPPTKNVEVGDTVMWRVIAARESGLPADADRGWRVREAGGSSGSAAKKDGKELPGIKTVVVSLPPETERCSIDFHAAVGSWQTVGATQSQGAFSSSNGPSCIFGIGVPAQGGTFIAVSHNIRDHAVRLVAADRDGQERRPVRTTGSGVGSFSQIGAQFDLTRDAIKEYRLQSRSYQRVELRGIVVKPDGVR